MQACVDKRKRNICIVALSIALALAIAIAACALYVGDYYRADTGAIEAFAKDYEVQGVMQDDGTLVFAPQGATKGLIFYPGGKVEYTAYIPLMQACAEQGILCVLLKMPCNLAVLDVNAADGVQEQYPEIKDWYIGGHSLGGTVASLYLADHTEQFKGLILLGSYTSADLSATDLFVLSVYGSEDLVMNRENYEQSGVKLPGDYTEIVLEGGCHAYFGMYGTQDGDGTPRMTNEQQIKQTAAHIVALICNTHE